MNSKIKDKHIIELFKLTDKNRKTVFLDNNRVLIVWNITWGYDIGDDFAHITTNINPEIQDADIDHFYTNEIQIVEDQTNGRILYDRKKNEL